MNRFRPNLVVKGCRIPFEEDQWLALRIVPPRNPPPPSTTTTALATAAADGDGDADTSKTSSKTPSCGPVDGGGSGGGVAGVGGGGGGGRGVVMKVVKPCSRCKMPNTDQATGFAPSGFEFPNGDGGGSGMHGKFEGANMFGEYVEPEPSRTLKVQLGLPIVFLYISQTHTHDCVHINQDYSIFH